VTASQRRLDDELFVTAWLFEEGKHADFFRRFSETVVGDDFVLEPRDVGLQRRLFEVELAGDMRRLLQDASPAAQARAFTTYCLLLESLLAETGHRVLEDALRSRSLLPGLQEGLVLVNRDESRHVAYGLHVLRRLTSVDPRVAGVVQQRVDELAPLVAGVADAVMLHYEKRPFGVSYAMREPIQRLLAQLHRLAPTAL